MTTPDLLLGLIGDNIADSVSPALHEEAGRQAGILTRYDRLVPAQQGLAFEPLFAACPERGYRGLNITYPYKERVTGLITVDDPLVARLGACNTVLFQPEGPKGFNTDHTGFIAAYRAARGEAGPGAVLMIGTGGVGRAVAFGLVALGAAEIRLCDMDCTKAEKLAEELRAAGPGVSVVVAETAEAGAKGATGLINCTPLGMTGKPGSALDGAAMAGAEWAFDAVYTPRDTQFLKDAARHGLTLIPGLELFFWQGVHAFALFSGRDPDLKGLRGWLDAREAA